jgi:CBS domain-containing protein
MTHLPVEGERCETVADAARLMESNDIRHLPVMSGSHLQGIVSQRDILLTRVKHGDAAEAMVLEDICSKHVLKVGPLTPVNEVADQMLDRKIGSAVVVDGGYVVGLFTSTDALRTLRTLFG